jgi:RES domain-containing protein
MPYPNGVSEVIGDEWYDAAKHAILIAPSVLSPFEFNILINQMHRDVARITVGPPRPAVIDHR